MSFASAFAIQNNNDRTALTQGPSTLQRNASTVSRFRSDSTSGAALQRFPYSPFSALTYPAGGEVSEPIEEERPTRSSAEVERDVNQLARQMSVGGYRGGDQINRQESYVTDNPFQYEKNSPLDPFSDKFDGKKWVKSFLLASQGEEQGPKKLAGISYKGLGVHGFGSDADYQKTVANTPLSALSTARDLVTGRKRKVQIIKGADGVLEAGEMLVVLGPPGSGCSTLLKTIAGEMNGIYLDGESEINYRGITTKQMQGQFRGEAIYTAEVDVHFPKLTVGETLSFAAEARAGRTLPAGLSRQEYASKLKDVLMALFGISHTANTVVGNDFVRGVSGGERKRVTICEAALAGAPLQCWDNSTRGLDSANAIEFCKNLRLGSEYLGIASVVAIYQAPQSAYDIFDKVSLLYEGEQIYFGSTKTAKKYFTDMGFECPEQQTVPDFLTSLTSPSERTARKGWEGRVPHTPDEFARMWRDSNEYKALQEEIAQFNERHPVHGERYDEFLASRRAQQSKHTRKKSPYTMTYGEQVKLCLKRGIWRLKADPALPVGQLIGNTAMALIVSSVFYNLQPTTASFYQRSALIFFAILLNAFSSALEILTLYAQRPIVEKHSQYAFYHPSAEAFASMITDLPYKVLNAIVFNLILYFMANLRREPGAFFFFLLISFSLTLTMSMFFRSIGALSRTLEQALAPAAILILALVIYTGFTIPTDYMLGWSRWINYLDPIAYGFESLMVNEFVGREFACSTVVPSGPGYQGATGTQRICSAQGATPGSLVVDGEYYLSSTYNYLASHKWRNFGIIIAFMLGLMLVYLLASELITAQKSKGEVLVYPRKSIPKELKEQPKKGDVESNDSSATRVNTREGADESQQADESIIQRQTAIFSWKDVVYDIKIKGEPRRILDHVDGWVKPGTLTALMGVSGAGKTTLLDVLATRVTMGVVTGEMLVDGKQRDASFQRKTGYVQQQDLHLQTSTVREALRFSATLRQPRSVPMKEKMDYVEEVLKLLEMEAYADAVVGVPGEGLNVEQRKRLTIGVELVAKPELLLFLDEPTSGLDSQTSWNILMLLRKLTAHGQAILCTIHQPSAMLFEQFDRLLFLAKGGKTVYYGEVGKSSKTLIEYFTRNGAEECPPDENPAEWMLSITKDGKDWHQIWKDSPERQSVRDELQRLKDERPDEAGGEKGKQGDSKADKKTAYAEFAAPFGVQFWAVLKRVFQQYWRTPSYIYSKTALCVLTGLFIGFSFFRSGTSQQGLQNQLFSVFMLFTIFGQMVQQITPNFVVQRSLYEVRERPSKTYSWKVFILSQIVVEIPWAMLMGLLLWATWYWPIGYYRNAIPTGAWVEREALMFLYIECFMIFTSTFATAAVAGLASAEAAGNAANVLFSLCLIFCGVLVPGGELPRFWIFLYRVSPFTYLVEGMLSVAVANTQVQCSNSELLRITPPNGQTCQAYLSTWISEAGGQLINPTSTTECQYCALDSTNTFLSQFQIYYSNRWRDFGLLWAYICFNVAAAIFLYWLARVPKHQGKEQTTEDEGKKE